MLAAAATSSEAVGKHVMPPITSVKDGNAGGGSDLK